MDGPRQICDAAVLFPGSSPRSKKQPGDSVYGTGFKARRVALSPMKRRSAKAVPSTQRARSLSGTTPYVVVLHLESIQAPCEKASV